MRKIASVAAVAASVLMSGAAWAQVPSNAPYMWDPHMMWGGGWYTMIFSPLVMIVFLVLLVGAVAFVLRGTGMKPTPLDILKERYARGEIDKSEFTERRQTLGV